MYSIYGYLAKKCTVYMDYGYITFSLSADPVENGFRTNLQNEGNTAEGFDDRMTRNMPNYRSNSMLFDICKFFCMSEFLKNMLVW